MGRLTALKAVIAAPMLNASKRPSYPTYVLILLALVNVSSYVDRSVLSVLAPQIRTEFGISDTMWGIVAGMAFAVPYALLSVPLAMLADRWSRPAVLALSVAVWSGMTALCGAATNIFHLGLGRMGVGAGEAGCLPPAQGIISSHFPPEKRSGAMAVNFAGVSAGGMLGLILGGWIGQLYGWRTAFLALGAPGLLLALIIVLTLRDKPRSKAPEAPMDDVSPSGLFELIRRRPAYFHLMMAFGSNAFFVAASYQWLPSFYVREYQFSIAEAGMSFGLASGLAAIVGVIVGGWVGNKLQPKGYLRMLRFGMATEVITMIFSILMLISPVAALSLTFNFFAAAMGMMANGPLFALVHATAPPDLRSRASSMLTMMSALIGMSGGPILVGFLSDQFQGFAGDGSLRYALLASTLFCLWPIFHYAKAARTIARDVD